MTNKIIVSREGAVLSLELNRPDKKNALDRGMYETLMAEMAGAEANDGVRAVLLRGAGGAFTGGNDLADFLGVPDDFASFPALRFVKALAAFEKPLVAAVAGDAVGVGTTLLFHCDLVYAAPTARFKMPFVDLGVPPEAGASLLVPRRLGRAKAAQFLMLCESFGAQEAERLGVVNAIAPADELMSVALEAAQRLAAKPAAAVAATRRLLRGDPKEILARIDEEAALFAQMLADPGTRARLEAFLADRRGNP